MIYIKHFGIPFLLLILLTVLVHAKTYTQDEVDRLLCDRIAKRGGAAHGVLLNGKCGDWNPIDIDQKILFINRNMTVDTIPEAKRWDD